MLLTLAASLLAFAGMGRTSAGENVDRFIASMFSEAPADWQARVAQDETQCICSNFRNNPPSAEAAKIMELEKASVPLPPSGILTGNWKAGEAIAQSGRGGQFTDGPGTANGGNCYACHQISPGEISYGTLGPSLLKYGKNRGFGLEEAKATYEKIYDPQISSACSLMPRFGHNKVLTEQQIKDLVAYLFDPQSPVNQ
ncbi:MAG: sulfur oxidation c-type cytochrome SoxX [Rhodomicrobium sp.]